MEKIDLNNIVSVNGQFKFFPSGSILNPTSSNASTAAQVDILVTSDLPENFVSDTTLNPYIWAKTSINNYKYCCDLAKSLLEEFKFVTVPDEQEHIEGLFASGDELMQDIAYNLISGNNIEVGILV